MFSTEAKRRATGPRDDESEHPKDGTYSIELPFPFLVHRSRRMRIRVVNPQSTRCNRSCKECRSNYNVVDSAGSVEDFSNNTASCGETQADALQQAHLLLMEDEVEEKQNARSSSTVVVSKHQENL